MRVFKRSKKYIGNTNIESEVSHWEWTKGRGLFVIFKDGFKIKSAYSLNELLSGTSEGPILEKFDDAATEKK